MSEQKLKRLSKLPGSKTSKQSQSTKLEGLEQLVSQLQEIAAGQQMAAAETQNQIKQLSLAVLQIADKNVDVTPIVEAIQALSDKIDAKEQARMLMDYEITFDRDKYNLMKSGIKLSSVPKKLN